MPSTTEIFFSYAWGDAQEAGESREKLVDELYASLVRDGFRVVRDKYDLHYKGYISDFMARIGEGRCIIIAISGKYVKSPYCMFELYEIARHAAFDKYRFREKVLPIMVERIDFTRPSVIDEHLTYWEETFHEWDSLVKKRAGELSIENLQRYDKIKMIYQHFGKLMEWLADMNTMSTQLVAQDNFAAIKQEIARMLSVAQPELPAGSSTDKARDNAGTVVAEKPPATATYNMANIRKFLVNALDDTAFSSLCMDYFGEVYNRFTDGQNKLQKINLLLDFCKRNIKFNLLLEAMQESNSGQFDLYKPYA